MTLIREKAKEIVNAIPDRQIKSCGDTAALYTRYTGLTQAMLEADWRRRGPKEAGLTGCNSFVGWYGAQLGSERYCARYDIVISRSTAS